MKRNSILQSWLLGLALLFVLAFTPQAWATANYVYHERTGNNPGCGADPYVNRLTPLATESVTVAFKVEFQFYTDSARVYYTTDGSAPVGAFGNASNSTQVILAGWSCNFGSPLVDVWTATIPAQPAGTVVKYIVSAWHSGGGDEVFGNSGACCPPYASVSGDATVFSYTTICSTPSVTCPANITTNTAAGLCSQVVAFTPTVTGDCSPVLTCNPASGSTFAKGVTAVVCGATNTSGFGASCTFNVTVLDNEAPVISGCPTAISLNTTPGLCTAVAAWTAPTATDNCDGARTVTCTPASGSTFAKGPTTVTCRASDTSLNTNSSCTFTVTVTDAELPACPANVTVNADSGQCSKSNVTFAATDNCAVTNQSCTPPSGSTFAVGTNTVNCTLQDSSGNTTVCSFTVAVRDTQAPVVTCPANMAFNRDSGQLSRANVTWTATANDNCGGAVGVICTPVSGSTFPVGATTVTCSASDAAGNTGTCTFQVAVLAPALVHRYNFAELSGTTVSDFVGTAHGTITNPVFTGAVTNYVLAAGKLTLTQAGTNMAFVDLPNGLASSMTNATFEAWVTWNGGGNNQRIMDFGNVYGAEGTAGTGSNYIILTPKSGNTFTPSAFVGRWFGTPVDLTVSGPTFGTGTPTHVAATFDWDRKIARLFVNGVFAGYSMVTNPLSAIQDVNNWLGRSQWSGDPFFAGSFDEFRIYNTALSAAQVAASAAKGPDVPSIDPGTIQAVHLIVTNAATPSNTIASWTTRQVAVTADFTSASNVDVTVGETVTYTSSDTNVFTVDTLGFVRSKNPGSATLTVSYQGKTDSSLITVAPQDAARLVHRYSFNDAPGSTTVTDSVGVAHGTIINPTNTALSGGKLTLQGGTAQLSVNGYVALPTGILATMSNATFEAWVTMSNAPNWQRLFDMGSGQNSYIFFAGQNVYRLAYKFNATAGENPVVLGPAGFPQNSTVHVVCTYNSGSGVAKVFVNGVLVRSGVAIYPLAAVTGANNWLGRSQFSDPYWKGDYQEFRMYEGSMSEGDVALSYAAGPDTLPGTAGNMVGTISLVASNVMNGAFYQQQAQVLVNFQNTNNINIAQNNVEVIYQSSDPTVVSVSTSGFITALRPGAATITASYHGMSSSVIITVLPGVQTLAHRYNFNEGSGTTVLDAVAGAGGNGTIIGTNFSRTSSTLSINASNTSVQTTYIDLPNGMISSLSNATFEGWTTWTDWSANWQRIFDFGSSQQGEGNSGTGTNTLYLTPRRDSGIMQVEVHTNTANVAVASYTRAFPSNALTHFVLVYNSTLSTMSIYLNGAKVASGATTQLLRHFNDFNNWLGRSQYSDPYYRGSFSEFRIYTNALLDSEILASYNLGPDATLTPPVIANLAPKAVTTSTAFPAGTLSTNAAVRLYWGTNDGVTTFANWTNVVDLGVQSAGQVYTKLSGLSQGVTYFYRFYATNVLGQSWASSAQSFIPVAPFQPLGYGYTLTNIFGGYTLPETLVNFPALVVLNTSVPGFTYDEILSLGAADLRFVDGSGKELNYEIDTWNTNGSSYVWVQVPEFTNNASVQMYWGKAGLSVPSYSTNGATWNDGFAGVWHMTNSLPPDSSAHGFNATYCNAPGAVSSISGMIGTAQNYAGALGNAYTYVGTGLNFTNTTLSAWIWCRSTSDDGAVMCKDGGTYGPGDLYFWQQGTVLRFETYNWGQDVTQPLANSGAAGSWIHLAVTVNGLSQTIYTNGVLAANWTKAMYVGQNAHQFQLAGSIQSPTRNFDGRLDECRAEWLPRSPAWIRACYLNQSAPSQFQTQTPVFARPLPLTLALPTISGVDTNLATLGARVISDGGNGVSSWGTVLAATPSPANNFVTVIGLTNAPFTFALLNSGLTPGAHYYTRAWASNTVEGRIYSPDGEFYAEPYPATSLSFANVTNKSMTISWTADPSSAGSLVLVRAGSPVSTLPADGVVYTANSQYAQGQQLSDGSYVVYAGSGTSVSAWDLNKNTTYYVAVFAYAGSGALINYQQDTPATGSQLTGNAYIIETAGQLLVDVNMLNGLQTDNSGAVTNWLNNGTVGGGFTNDGAAATYPTLDGAGGQSAVSFNGAQHLRSTFAAPAQITGANSFSIEYWALNPSIANEEWIFAWGWRGTEPRCAALGYGTSAAFGLAGHWGNSDLAFGEGVTGGGTQVPVANAWHHIVVTYDGTTERGYVDGALNARENKALNIWPGGPCIIGDQYSSSANNGVLTAYGNLKYSGYLTSLRVHSGVLTPGQVSDNYSVGPVLQTPVSISGQPQSQTVLEFGTATFRFPTVGSAVSYQWYSNSVALGNGTNLSYTLASVLTNANGAQFQCIASNNYYGVAYMATSQIATLTVVPFLQGLIHRYSFSGDLTDSVGGANSGTLQGAAYITNGQVYLNGTANTYVNLPAWLLANRTSATFEFWASYGTSGIWARLFDFGDISGTSGVNYLFYSPHNGSAIQQFNIRTNGAASADDYITASPNLDGRTNVHVACVYDGANSRMSIYTNGVLEVSGVCSIPLTNVVNVYSYLGKSLFSADSPLNASIDEFRIYSFALTSNQVIYSYTNGADGFVPAYIITQPQSVTISEAYGVASFSGLAGGALPVTYQWYRGGAAVLNATNTALTLSGLTPADSGTTLYLVANNTYAGTACSATSAVVSVTVNPIEAGLYHRYSFSSDGTDSLGGANGTLQGSAFVQGLKFDGATTYISVPVTNSTARTLAAWVNPQNSMVVAHIASVFDCDVGGQYGAGWGVQNGKFRVLLDDTFWDTGVSATLYQWQHVALSFTTNVATLYVNGAAVASTNYPQGSVNTTNFYIGRSHANAAEFWNGGIYDAQIYDHNLSVAEIVTVYGGATNNGLMGRYLVTQTQAAGATDTSGNGRTGTWTGTPASGLGGALNLFSGNSYLNLPGGLITGYTNLTVEFWAKFNTNAAWARVFDFGNTNNGGGENYILFTPHDFWTNHQIGLRNNVGGIVDNTTSGSGTLDGRNVHVACVYDSAASLMRIYTNGVFEVSTPATVPLTAVSNVYSFIGRSLFSADPYLRASVDELRIYKAALTDAQVWMTQVLGPDQALVEQAAQIVTQPTDRTVAEGTSNIIFAVLANGKPPIAFQWYRSDDSLIAGATSTTYSIPLARLADAGGYYCVASNEYNAVSCTATSRVATLTVLGAAASLAHWYPFYVPGDDYSLIDYTFSGANGSAVNTVVFTNNDGIYLDGSPGVLNSGILGNYMELPSGIISGWTAATFEFWATFGTQGNPGTAVNWARVFDFGYTNAVGGGANYIMFTPHTDHNTHRFEIVTTAGSVLLDPPGVLDGRTIHVACVYDPASRFMAIYTNGVMEVSATTTVPLTAVSDVYSWVGRSLFTNDAYLKAEIDDFRLYNSALTAGKVLQSYQQGKDTPLGQGTPIGIGSLIIAAAPADATVDYSRTAVFSVRAAGEYGAPLTYQWYSSLSGLMVGQTGPTLTLSGVSSADAGVYTVAVTNSITSEGTELSATLTVLQVTLGGTVTLEAYQGTARDGAGTRDVTFSYTDGASYTNRVVQTLAFAGGAAPYSFIAPHGAIRVSAKTAWTLRSTVAVSLPGTPVADFVLRGGDLDGSDTVGLDDYYRLAAVWYQADAAADIDGSGLVDGDDYFILANHWGESGDAE